MATYSKKERLEDIVNLLSDYESSLQAAEWIVDKGKPALISALKDLRPTRAMLQDYGYGSLKEFIEYIEETLN